MDPINIKQDITYKNGTHHTNQHHEDSQVNGDGKISMKKNLGAVSGISIIVGSVIGSGIFISPIGVLRSTGSVGLCLVVWALSGVIAMCGGFCYAELGTLLPKSGGEYVYIKTALGEIAGFLYAWKFLIVDKPTSIAIVSLTFSSYSATLFELCGGPQLPIKLIAAIVIIIAGFINVRSATFTANTMVVFATAKLVALGVIIVGGSYRLSQGQTENLATGFEGTTQNPLVVASAFNNALWAYNGWQNLTIATEELRDYKKNIPRCIGGGVLIIIIVYLLTNISYLTVLSVDEMLNSPTVAMSWGEKVLGPAKILMTLSVMISTFGAVITSTFTGGRMIFAAGRDCLLPEVLSFIHVKYYTPVPSLLITITLGIIMIIPGNIRLLLSFFGFVNWTFYALAFLSVIVLRFTMKDKPRPIKVPIIFPIVLVPIALYIVLAPIVVNPSIEYLYVFLFVMAGLIFYFPLVYYKKTFWIFDEMTMNAQLLLEVVPSKQVKI